MTLPTQLVAAADSIRAVREARPGVKVLVGGGVITRHPGLTEPLGADAAGVDCVAAGEAADRLVPAPGA